MTFSRKLGDELLETLYAPRTESELRRFFGPIDAFMAESQEGDALLRFTMSNGELTLSRLPVQR